MSAIVRNPMTMEEFVLWEERQEARYEFAGAGPVAMNGGTWAHGVIGDNIVSALKLLLRGKPCKVAGSNIKIELAGRIRCPDAFVVCAPVAPKATVIRDPVIVFEVLSASTAHTDRFHKLREYGATPSILRHVIVEQDARAAMVYVRPGNRMQAEALINEDVLDMPEIGIWIPLTEFYEGVNAEVVEDRDDAPC